MKTFLSALAVCASFVAVPAFATTYVEGVIVEGPNVTLPSDPFYDNPTVLFDFSDPVTDPVLSFTSEAWIFGRVYEGYSDGFTIDATGYTYDLQISALGGSRQFEMGVDVGSDSYVLSDTSTVFVWEDLTGITEIDLSGMNGNTKWLVDIVNIAAVPLPATGFLLIAGLGGLGAMRRRKKA